MVSDLEDVTALQKFVFKQTILASTLDVTRQQKTVPSVGGLKDQRSIVSRPAVVSRGSRPQNFPSHFTEGANFSLPQGDNLDAATLG